MFSVERIEGIQQAFEDRMPHYQAYGNQIVERIMQCDEVEAVLLKFLYGTMPLSDGVNYDFEVFLDYAKQAVLLRQQSSYSKDLDEDIFLNYVVYHRINEEEISSCRSFFYDLLKERLVGKSLGEAILEVNYWCSEEVTYQSTDERTASAMTIFNGAYGRCGEESTFTVSALRSVGIPSRQVYAPRWSHCDDNHAWAEVYADGKWQFLGACEPEEVLNKGWFTNASSRAMLVHSRRFDTVPSTEEAIEQVGVATLLNNLELYAKTAHLTVEIKDEEGHCSVEAEVDFEILNYAEFYPIATVKANAQGIAHFTTGLGSIKVVAKAGEKWASQVVDTRTTSQVTLTLGQAEVQNEWQMVDMIAPVDTPIHGTHLTPEQKALGKDKFEAAAKKRLQKVTNFFKTWVDGDQRLIEEARANYGEIQKFLEDEATRAYGSLKEKVLGILTKKDFRDVKSDILLEHLTHAAQYIGQVEEDIFVQYILNPRINLEPMTKYRHFIEAYYSEDEKQTFREEPKKLWEQMTQTIEEKDEYEYANLTTSPAACLAIQTGSKLSQHILFVAVCRTLGVPARLNPMDTSIEYYEHGVFVPVEVAKVKDAMLQLVAQDDTSWVYTQNWTLGKWDYNHYETLDLSDIPWEEDKLRVDLEPGRYRIITSNRLPNGNCFIYTYTFTLEADEVEVRALKLREAKLSEMLSPVKLPNFTVSNEEGISLDGFGLLGKDKQLCIWLEVSKEPTEHILNELYAYKERFQSMQDKIYFFIKESKDLTDPTLSKVLEVMPNVHIYYDTFEENIELLARRMYVDPDKLPLIMVTQNENEGLYATSGYNVGTGDMLLRVLL